jgi:hypothetical protein
VQQKTTTVHTTPRLRRDIEESGGLPCFYQPGQAERRQGVPAATTSGVLNATLLMREDPRITVQDCCFATCYLIALARVRRKQSLKRKKLIHGTFKVSDSNQQ